MRERIQALIGLVAACHLAACTAAPAPPPAPAPNVLLIVVDTLRADRLGCYGNTRGLTPFIDSLAARGTVFHRAYAQSSWTNPSIASLLTSRQQSQHGVTGFGSVLAPEENTLPEVLQEHGYRTVGFTANFLVRGQLGFKQGFEQYRYFLRHIPRSGPRMDKERAERLNREALAWLAGSNARRGNEKRPVFLYLHYMEPHAPYDPPDALLDKVLDGRARPNRAAVNDAMNISNFFDFTDGMLVDVQHLYDAEILSLDSQLRELFGALAFRGFLQNAVIVFTADHGEEFKEHGIVGHHQTLFNQSIHVPLIIVAPGQTQRVDVHGTVALVDVAPTVLALANIKAPASFEGRSLLGISDANKGWLERIRTWARGRDGPEMPAFSELIKDPATPRYSPHERAVILGPHKLVVGVEGEHEFYDLEADGAERNPTALADPDREQLTRALARLEQYRQHAGPPPPANTPDAATRDRMRALGYRE